MGLLQNPTKSVPVKTPSGFPDGNECFECSPIRYRLVDDLSSFEPTLLGTDEDPHVYSKVGELGDVRNNATYESANDLKRMFQ